MLTYTVLQTGYANWHNDLRYLMDTTHSKLLTELVTYTTGYANWHNYLRYLMDTTHSKLLTELVQSTTALQTLTSSPNMQAASYMMHYRIQQPRKQLVVYIGKNMAQKKNGFY